MFYCIACFYLCWITTVIILQLSKKFEKLINTHFLILSGVLPKWGLFSPNPVQGEYELDFRTTLSDGTVNSWQNIKYRKEKKIKNIFVNSNGDFITSVHTCCKYCVIKRSNNYPVGYLLLLNYIKELVKSQDFAKLYKLQFRLRWKTPYSEKVYLISQWHDLRIIL